jgi:hypothetical protein
MSRLLDSHPHLALAPDIHWITEFFETRNGINPEGLMARELLAKWADQNRFAAFGLDREMIRDLLAPGERVPLAEFIDRLLDRFGLRNGKSLVGNVVPDYTQIIPVIHAVWPQVKFIHAIQDGRDIYLAGNTRPNPSPQPPPRSGEGEESSPSSLLGKGVGALGEDPATTFALAWRRKVKQGRRAGKVLGPELYHEALYEDFFKNPGEACSRLWAFLNVSNHVKDRSRELAPDGERNQPGCFGAAGLMSAEEIECFEAAAGDLLDDLNYLRLAQTCRPEIVTHVARVREQFSLSAGPPRPSTRSLARSRRKNRWSNPFVFVVGCPRSGTTLLQRILDAHPQLAVCPESFWIVYYYQNRVGLRPDGRITPEIIDRLFEYHKFYRMKQDRQDLEKMLGQTEPISYADFVSGIFDAYAEDHGKPLAGDKTPDYVRNLPVLHQLWPKAKFVHLIRDGRDVALSAINWKRKAAKLRSLFPTWHEHPLATAAAWWKWHVAPARERGRSLGPTTYYELCYEKLVDQPEKECARLCEFLGLPFDAAMLRFHEGQTRLEPELDAKNSWRPITPGLRNWRQEMTLEDVELFQAVAGGLLEELEYPLAIPRPAANILQYASSIQETFDQNCERLGDWLA